MAQSSGTQRNAVEDQANWTLRVRTEQRQSKRFADEWGFLFNNEQRALSRSVSPVKYHGRSGTSTVKQIRVPERAHGTQLPTLSPEKLSERPMRPSTAMESVVMSHTLQREYMQQRNPFYIPSSHTYGSRLSLEQFGVSQHGIKGMRSQLMSR